MPNPQAPVGRIRDVAAQIKALEERLMRNRTIPMNEQSIIHAEIRRLRKEQDTIEKRTR